MRKGWTTKRLGEVGTFERGGGFLKSDYVDDGFPCIHYGQIHTTFGVSTHHHLTCIPEELAKFKSKLAKNGDVIIAITSEDVEGSCKCTAWLGGYDVAVGGHTAIFRHNLNPTFVSYYFRGRHYSLAKEKYAHGFKVVEIKPADIAKIDISYPSLSEQERIVAELDLLQGIIDKQKAQLKELDTLAQSIFYDMFGDPESNSRGWNTMCLKDICKDLFAGGDVPRGKWSQTKTAEYPIPIISNGIGAKAIYGYTDQARVFEECITISGRGTIGHCEIRNEPFFPVVRVIVALPDTSLITPIILQAVIAALHLKGVGVAIPQLTIPMVKNVPIIIPPLPLQESFSQKVQAIERQKASINASIAETQKLFDYTMDKYFG